MTLRDDRGRMQDVLEYACEAVEMCRRRTREDLDRDRIFNLATSQLLTLVGAGTNRISPDKRTQMPDVAWSRIARMRERLVHEYDEVDSDAVWDAVNDDLPPLIAALEEILGME